MTSVQEAIQERERRVKRLVMTPFHHMANDLVMQRVALKFMKDWKRADEIRDRLNSYGFELTEYKRDTKVSIPGTDYFWFVTTDLTALAENSGPLSGFVPHTGPPIDTEAEAEWYRQKAEREAANAGN